jgi:hypothetical protein
VAIRFYVDADLLGLAKLLVTVRSDVTYPGDPGGVGVDGAARASCPVSPGDKDPEWIPNVAGLGWAVITRDRHIKHRPAERAAVVSSRARHITLDARTALDRWGQLEIVVPQWRALERLADSPGPWVFTASRTVLRKEF